MALLELQNLQKHFGKTQVLRDLSLQVEEGQFVTLLGPSGCGKTTTLRIVAGLTDPDGGDVLLEGRSMLRLPPEKRELNTVFQNYALFPHMNVEKNVAYALRLMGMPARQRAARVAEMLKLVQMEGYEKRMPDKLSGGQRQRIAIARAVAPGRKLLLLDEPLGALDLKLRRQMQEEIKGKSPGAFAAPGAGSGLNADRDGDRTAAPGRSSSRCRRRRWARYRCRN